MTTDLARGVEVLLVEDDETTRVFLTKMMEGMGYSVEAVPHAEDGLRRSREHFFPVMVIDWLMPDGHMNGLELIRHIRAQPDGDRSAILVVTVRDQASDLEAVMNAGADDYIPKPVSADVLRIRLRIAQERTRHLVARASAEYALEQSETRLRTVVANAPLILFLLDRKGVFTYADGRGLSVLGLERSQVVGQSVFDVYRDVPDIAGHVSRALSGETFTSNSTIRGVSLESWYTPLQSMPGELPDGVIVVSTDVTERKKVEQELRDSEARFRSFSEAAFEGLALLDRGVVIDANQQIADMFSVDSGEVLGTRALDFVAKEDRVRANRYLTESRTTPFELNAVRRTGERIRVEVRLRPLAVGERLVTVAAVHDITQKRRAEEERKRLEDQFRQARKLESLGVLAGGIAHDFNNLLMGVLGNASLVLMDLPEESPIAAYVHQIETAAQRAAELTNQMLAFSGKGRFVVKRLNMSDFIRENAQYLEDSIGGKTTIQYRLDEDLPAIDGDTGQIRQIITNLVANAADAIGEAEGVIRISTGVRRVTRDAMSGTLFAGEVVDGFRVYLEVRDSGIGMDNGTLARVFDPFFTTKFTGRGLGMAAVLGIVRGHKGAIKIASQQNSGTTVTVLFPPADEAEITTGDAEETQPPTAEESRTVLVIDDEEAVRMVTGTMLERSGFNVLLAEDGRKGIELYKSNAPEIVAVLLDLTMPDLTGDQVFEEIRVIDPTVRVILMSGYDQKEATKRFGTEGLAGFLQKPFAARVLRERLASLTTS